MPIKSPGVLITRPVAQAHALIEKLSLRNIPTYTLAVTDIKATSAVVLPDDQPDALIFFSPNAVEHGQFILNRYPDLPTISIGPTTAQRLVQCHRPPILTPQDYSSEGLTRALSLNSFKHLLLVTGKGGRNVVESDLRSQSLRVSRCEVYERARAHPDATKIQTIRDAIFHRHIAFLSATSIQILDDAIALINDTSHLLQQCHVICLSQRIAQHAQACGFNQVSTAAQATEAQLLESIVKAWSDCRDGLSQR
jgi:uroporphyrinogen-III synthase